MGSTYEIRSILSIFIGILALQGCAMMGESIPPEQLAKLATVEGASGYPIHSVDSKTTLFTTSVNVEPGMHEFETIESCFNNNCSYIHFKFNARPGYLYRLTPNRTILVLDRNDEYHRKLDELRPIGNSTEYVTKQQTQAYYQNVAKQATQARADLMERRRMNLPLVRKLGTKICKQQGQFLYVGYVESFTDEKLQIRVADALIAANHNYRDSGFTPSIVWDSPMNWDLCE